MTNVIVIYYDGNDTRAAKCDLSLWPLGSYPDGLEDFTDHLGLPPDAQLNIVILTPDVDNTPIYIPKSGIDLDYSSGINRAYELGHILYTTSDSDRPDVICDCNGEVVLGLCRRCNKGEVELDKPCVPCPTPDQDPPGQV